MSLFMPPAMPALMTASGAKLSMSAWVQTAALTLYDAVADVDDTGVTHLVDIVVETSLFLDLRIGETQADVYEF